jgi:hypothetical protein
MGVNHAGVTDPAVSFKIEKIFEICSIGNYPASLSGGMRNSALQFGTWLSCHIETDLTRFVA